MPDPPEDAEAAKGKEGSEGSERGGASLKQQRLIENGWEESRFTANLITICSRETRRRIPNELLWTAPEGNSMSNTPRQLPSSEPEDLRRPKSKKGVSRPGCGPLRRARLGQVFSSAGFMEINITHP